MELQVVATIAGNLIHPLIQAETQYIDPMATLRPRLTFDLNHRLLKWPCVSQPCAGGPIHRQV